MCSACCWTRWPRLFSHWRAAGQRRWKPGLIGGVLATGAEALICSSSFELAADGFQLSSSAVGAGHGPWRAYLLGPTAASTDSGPAGPAWWRQR
jgi:hypothetical protein